MILNIIICYNNADEVKSYIESTRGLDCGKSVKFIVVINAVKKEESEIIEKIKSYDYVQVYMPEKNVGYINGLLYGYEEYSKNHDIKDVNWIVLSNTDIEYEKKSFLAYFLNKNYDDDIWCVAPSVYSKNTSSYSNPSSLYRRSRKEIDRLIKIFSNPFIGSLYIFLSKLKRTPFSKRPKSQYIYEVHGCYFIIRRCFIELLIKNKYQAFLYSEETYIAEHAYKNGKRIYYDDGFQVIHNEHSVTKKVNYVRKTKLFAESLLIIRDNFYKND